MRSTSSSFVYMVGCSALALLARTAIAAEVSTAPATMDATASGTPATEFKRPEIQPILRWKEDWSVLKNKDANSSDDLFDPIKYLPLSEDGSIWASFGGSARMRLESWQNFNLGKGEDDTYPLWRAQLYADLHVTPYLRFYAEGISAFVTDRDIHNSGAASGNRAIDTDSIDLLQGFADVILPLDKDLKVTVRGGRQFLLFGKQRLVSPLPWVNSYRTFDGVSSIIETGGWTITPFWTQLVVDRKYDFDQPDEQTQFYGFNATGPSLLGIKGMKQDLYYLGLNREDNVTFHGTKGFEHRQTVGGRVFGTVPETGLDYDAEGAYQFGKLGGQDINAFMVASEVGYKFADIELKPRPFVGFDYASGDSGSGGEVNTFNQLFPLGHAYYGYADVLGRQNAIDGNFGLNLTPIKELTFTATQHFFWKAENADAAYNVTGGAIGGTTASSTSELGSEFDFTANYIFNQHLSMLIGYSHYFANGVLNTATRRDADFFYCQLDFRF